MTLDLPLDDKLAASINRRRIAEEQRKIRIFNPRQRLIGLDIDALNHQVHDAQLARSREKELEETYSKQALKHEKIAIILEKQKEEEIRKLNEGINKFRLSEQKPEYRRDFDLYDPDLKKKELPPRLSDDDPRCSISGLQKLEGEDLGYKDRDKKQKEQLRDILQQQMQEKRLQTYTENKLKSDWESMMRRLENRALQLDKLEEEMRRNVATDAKEINMSLALNVKELERQKNITEEMENRQDIYNQFYGDLLSENPSVARSAFGPHRVVPDRWKGMSKDQLQEYYKGQVQQMFENKRRREQDAQDAAKWDELQICHL